jgi:ribosome biogenesis SPOUT family RNA methylase Rps3
MKQYSKKKSLRRKKIIALESQTEEQSKNEETKSDDVL